MRILRQVLTFTFLTAIIAASSVRAQGLSSSGTDYWLGFMPNGVPGSGYLRLNLFIASGTKNKVKIAIQGSTRSISLAAGDIYDMLLDQNAVTTQEETPSDNAVHITSQDPITVYAYNVWTCAGCQGGSPDGYLALPIEAYGTKYYTVNFPDDQVFGSGSNLRKGEFLIVAPYDNTDVTISPAAPTLGGHVAHTPFSVSLKRGQTYLVQSPGTQAGDNDLTGSLITSSRPVAVITGHEIASVGGLNSADHFAEMPSPVDKWGTQYFDMPMAGRTACGDYIRVLSAEDGNQVTYNGKGPFYLNAGEYADRDLQTDAEVYTSTNNKKFIVAQYSYSQGFNGDPGLADPFMILFTPQQQFEKEMIFRTPTPSKSESFMNYVTFISQYDSIKRITINGQLIGTGISTPVGLQQFPNTNPIMAAYRVRLPATQRNYVAKSNVPFGAYQYGFSNYEGYGWPTGQALRIISPDTLPPLLRVLDTNCGTYHVKFFEPRLKPTFSFDDTRIASVAMIDDSADLRWPKASYNYLWLPDPNFLVGDSVTTGTLQIIDPSKEGYAALYTVDRAGNDTVYEFHYYPPQVTFNPLPTYDFGEVILGNDSCRTIYLANVQQAGDFRADSAYVVGGANGGTFDISPRLLSAIHAHDSVALRVCYHPTDTGITSVDTFYVISHCVPYAMPVIGTGVTPLIYAPDLDFGEVDSGKTLCKTITIRNPGRAPLVITAQDLVNDPDFSVDPSQKFPIVIPPNGKATVLYCFHPHDWGNFGRRVTFLNQNPTSYQHSIKDTSLLTGIALPAGAKLTSYSKIVTAGCSFDTLYDTLYNNLPADKLVDGVDLVGPDASFFTIVSQQPSYPIVLVHDSGSSIPFEIQYNPTKNGFDLTPRTATMQVHAHGGGPQPALTINAQLVTPIANVSTTSLDLGKGRVTGTVNGSFTITNTGNAPLDVTSYGLSGAGASAFTFSPAPPFTVAAGGQQLVTVTATAQDPGEYDAAFSIGGPCQDTGGNVKATFSKAGDQLLGTDHGNVYIGGCRSNKLYAPYTSSFTDPVTITGWTIDAANGWNDFSDFAIDTTVDMTNGITIEPGTGPFEIPIKFTPTQTGPRAAALVVTFKGKGYLGNDSTWTLTQEVQGVGNAVTREIAIGNVTSIPVYHQTPSAQLDVPIVIDRSIETGAPTSGTAEAYGYVFNVSWKRDAFKYATVSPGGVNVSAPKYDATTDMETRTVSYRSPVPLSSMPTLATLTLESMLTKADSSPIVLSTPIWLSSDSSNLCYATTTVAPGAFVLDPQCGSSSLQSFLKTGNIIVGDIHPNPVTSSATINCHLATNSEVTVEVYDMMGYPVDRTRFGFKAGDHEIPLATASMPSGVYYCRVSDGRVVITKRFEITK